MSVWAGDHKGFESDCEYNVMGECTCYFRPFDGLSALDVHIYSSKPNHRVSQLYTVPYAVKVERHASSQN